jgi:nucleotide-binding universal stress UspA family protein
MLAGLISMLTSPKAALSGSNAMTYSTIMVNLELGCSNAGVTSAAGDLAERFGSSVVGIAAGQPMPIIGTDTDGYYIPEALIEQERARINSDLTAAEAEFRDALQGRVKTISWRSNVMLGSVAGYIAGEARCADIVVTAGSGDTPSELTRRVNPGDLLMQMGRPVLLVPAEAAPLALDRVLVAWKDSQQARRAVSDALPLLEKASHVAVASIAAAADIASARSQVADVVLWLKRHGIKAVSVVARPSGDDAGQLLNIAREHEAGVLVAGAYGHSRLLEWALGGVTRHLLLHGRGFALLSH